MLGLASLQPTTSRHSPPASTGFGIIPIASQDAGIAPERWNFAFYAAQQIVHRISFSYPRDTAGNRPAPRAYLPDHVTPSAALASVVNAWKNAGDWPIKSPERVNAVAAA